MNEEPIITVHELTPGEAETVILRKYDYSETNREILLNRELLESAHGF